MDVGLQNLSALTIFSKYAKYNPQLKRRETWEEIVDRYQDMMIKKYPKLKDAIVKSAELIREKKVLPSMRALQFAGPAAEVNHARIYNCCYLPVDSLYSFSETMFLLLGGTGVGYSVQKHHIEQLPTIKKQDTYKQRTWLIEDSIMGWADSVKVLMKFYFEGGFKPKFDFRAIRHKGARLITAGGKAPGPEPLKLCLAHIDAIMERKEDNQKLTSLECHDIMCHVANSVLAGGIRRSAMIALFNQDDEDMITCKYGNWWELNEQRGRANNSAVLERDKIGEDEFFDLWKRIEASGSGEPGVYWTNNKDWGTNPSLRAGTKVLTSDGIFSIDQLEGKEFIVPNLNGQWSQAKCWKSGTNINLIELKLDTGESYFSSPEHEWPVFVNGRFVKVKAAEIKSDDLLPVNLFSREKLFQKEGVGTYNEGFLAGWIYGDGCITERSDTGKRVVSLIASDKDDVLEKLLSIVKTIDGKDRKSYHRGKSNEFQIGSLEFINWLDKYKIQNKSKGLPESIWKDWSEQMIRGFIDGIFSSDGHVPSDIHGITLTSSHYLLIKDVQDLLGFYGIKSTLKKKIQKGVNFPNGHSDKEYIIYTIRTTVQSRRKMSCLFKLSVAHKQKNLLVTIKEKPEFIKVIDAKITELHEDVWDISVKDDTHCFHLAQVTTGNCCEIALRPYQFCNLCEVNVSDVENQQDLNDRVSVASFFGTLQAGFTDFHYLRPIWQKTTQKDALIGIGMTGIGSGEILKYNLEIAANTAKVVNSMISEKLGTNEAARVTCIKPSGTTSLVLGTASGIHAWHAPYYLRTMRFNKNEDIAVYLSIYHPELCEDDILRPKDTLCVRIPVKAPEGSIFRTETAIDTLERVKKFSTEWIKPGHQNGDNTHNVSATISIDKNRIYNRNWDGKFITPPISEDFNFDEWVAVGEWMWANRDVYNGLSVLPAFDHTYKQSPFEDITQEQYEERVSKLNDIDLTKVMEMDDNVEFTQVPSCAGGACELE
jgi:hypothetical protein